MEALAFLETKSLDGREWLRRSPRVTHPTILELVREARESGLFYDDDTERYCIERIPGLPPHQRHGTERGPLLDQLGHEVYVAKCQLDDEKATAALNEARAEGFAPATEDDLVEGQRYVVRFGTLYVGREVATFGEAHEVRVKRLGGRMALLPKGSRTRGFAPRSPMIARGVQA